MDNWVLFTLQKSDCFFKLPTSKVVNVYPVTSLKNGQQQTVYPFSAAHATTMCKVQGQTLQKAVLWLDIDRIPPGTAYVALSRVKMLNDIYFLSPLRTNFITPVRPWRTGFIA